MIFSKDGMQPAPHKVKVIINELQNPKTGVNCTADTVGNGELLTSVYSKLITNNIALEA